MSKGKSLSIKEQTLLDSLKRALQQSPAQRIKQALNLSKFCAKLLKATKNKHKK